MNAEGLEQAVASSCNRYHLHLELKAREIARPMILTYCISNLDFPERYRLSVIGHELWHFTGTSATKPKRELLLEALRDELELHPNLDFVEEFNCNLALLWEALAYQAQLIHPSTSAELADQIKLTMEENSELAELAFSVHCFLNTIVTHLKEPEDLRIPLVVGYLHECIDILDRLEVPPQEIARTFRESAEKMDEVIGSSPSSDWTWMILSSMFTCLSDTARSSGKLFSIIDVSDPRKMYRLSLSGIKSAINHDFFVQDLRFYQELKQIVASDSSGICAKYSGAILDEFGVATALVHHIVDSLDSGDPRIRRVYVQNPAREAVFLRLQERISVGETYVTEWKHRLKKEDLIKLSKEYICLLRSLYNLSDLVMCSSDRDADSYRHVLYTKLRELII